MEHVEDKLIITTAFEDFGLMQKKLEELSLEAESAELQRIPNNTLAIGVDEAKRVLAMIDKFEEDDDVNTVFHNLELTEELQNALNEE